MALVGAPLLSFWGYVGEPKLVSGTLLSWNGFCGRQIKEKRCGNRPPYVYFGQFWKEMNKIIFRNGASFIEENNFFCFSSLVEIYPLGIW